MPPLPYQQRPFVSDDARNVLRLNGAVNDSLQARDAS
jgi:hypothetical protein